MAKQKNSQLDLIKTLLHDNCLAKGNDAKILIEKDRNGKVIMQRPIIDGKIKYLLYRFDPDQIKMFPYLADESGLKKICDYILFAEEGNNLHILLIELKHGTESARNQLIASECFIDFIFKSAKRIGFEFAEKQYIKKIRVSEERAKKRNRKTKPGLITSDENEILNYDHADVFRIEEALDTL